MVTFREDMGYHEAMVRGRAQDKAILNMINDEGIDQNISISSLYEKIKKEPIPFWKMIRVAKPYIIKYNVDYE